MHPCDFCKKTILFGGVQDGQFRFCGQDCAIQGKGLVDAFALPDALVDPILMTSHQAKCPRCNGPGPIDVHHYHSIWSIFILSRWVTKTRISCRPCGLKAQAFASVFSLIFGWWGFPWGIVITPLQIGKNLKLMLFPFSTLRPSKDFERVIRLTMLKASKGGVPLENPVY